MYKKDFPIFKQNITYLDSAASTQKPSCVLKEMDCFYRTSYSNVHKGNCSLSMNATNLYEKARETVAQFIHTKPQNIIFTRSATGAINLVATSLSSIIKKGDEILISISEHHANFVPWQQLALRTGATLKVFNILKDGRLNLKDFEKKLTPHTKFVAFAQISNVLGILNPVEDFIQLAHQYGAQVLIDGAQSIAHTAINVTKMGCDFFVFSGHKIYGPTGIGVLYGTDKALSELPPYEFGGDMIKEVSIEKTTFNDIPARFEAGTPAFTEAIGLACALNYVSKIGLEKIEKHEKSLTRYAMKRLKENPRVQFIGNGKYKSGIISFTVLGAHPQDLAFILSKENICIRTGHHCAMPLHSFLNTPNTLRISFGLYNEKKDIDLFIKALDKACSLLKED